MAIKCNYDRGQEVSFQRYQTLNKNEDYVAGLLFGRFVCVKRSDSPITYFFFRILEDFFILITDPNKVASALRSWKRQKSSDQQRCETVFPDESRPLNKLVEEMRYAHLQDAQQLTEKEGAIKKLELLLNNVQSERDILVTKSTIEHNDLRQQLDATRANLDSINLQNTSLMHQLKDTNQQLKEAQSSQVELKSEVGRLTELNVTLQKLANQLREYQEENQESKRSTYRRQAHRPIRELVSSNFSANASSSSSSTNDSSASIKEQVDGKQESQLTSNELPPEFDVTGVDVPPFEDEVQASDAKVDENRNEKDEESVEVHSEEEQLRTASHTPEPIEVSSDNDNDSTINSLESPDSSTSVTPAVQSLSSPREPEEEELPR